MSASSRLDLDKELNSIDETRNIEKFEEADFPALKSNLDLRKYAHHTNHNVVFKQSHFNEKSVTAFP